MNNINYNPDVLTCLANLSNDEVFTPPHIANQILDLLPAEIWKNKDLKFLDPFSKTGIFLREIAKRLIVGLESEIPDKQERINHIFKHQLYGVAITELTSLLSRRSLYCSKYANGKYSVCSEFDNEQGNLRYTKTKHYWTNGRCSYCGASRSIYDRPNMESYAYMFIHTIKPEEIFNMKFDVIVGNPPYQLSDGSGKGAGATPLYNLFVHQAKKLNPRFLCMIIPSRWFSGGRGLDEFRDEMLHDNRLRVIHDFLDASECFPGVEIKGGVCYFLWNRDHKGLCNIVTHEKGKIVSSMERPLLEEGKDTFIRYNEAIPIYKKISALHEPTMDTVVSSAKPFGLRTYVQGKPEKFPGSVKFYANNSVGYIAENEILQNKEWIYKHKVIAPYAVGSGDSKTDVVKPLYSEPGSCCSETYIVYGPYETKVETDNVISYIKTRFFHFFLTLKKNTQHATKRAYSFVPVQDFHESWNDEKLFEKYGLSSDEIEFIENMVHPVNDDE